MFQEPTPRERIRYLLDSMLSRGHMVMSIWLALLTILVVLLVAGIDWLLNLAPGHPSLGKLIWMSLLRTLDPGTMGSDQGSIPFLASMLFVTLAGIVIVSTLIGIINNAIVARLEDLRKGRSRVIENDHTVILGWTEEIFTIIHELSITNIHRKNPSIVILAQQDKLKMEEEIRERVGNTANTRIICRTGNPLEFKDLTIANLHTARSIIILSPGRENPDAEVIKTLLAIINNPQRREQPYHIVAVMRDSANLEVARMIGNDEVELLLQDDVISRIIAQTCRQSGLSVVYEEILDFAGDEFYFTTLPAIAGKTFKEALFLVDKCCLVGFRRQGRLHLNPPSDTIIKVDDELVCLAPDAKSIRTTDTPPPLVNESYITALKDPTSGPESTLILGVNLRTHRVIKELDRYVSPGSRVTVVSSSASQEPELRQQCSNLKHQQLEFKPGETTQRTLLESLRVDQYDRIVLMTDGRIPPQQADSRVLITLLHLRDISNRLGKRLTIVSEMIDPNNCRLASVARADDFIVGSKLVSYLLTQISETKGLIKVFEELFDAEGQELYIKPASLYVQPDQSISFATLIEAALRKGEIALGYRLAKYADRSDESFGIRLNPDRYTKFSLGDQDKVIVMASG